MVTALGSGFQRLVSESLRRFRSITSPLAKMTDLAALGGALMPHDTSNLGGRAGMKGFTIMLMGFVKRAIHSVKLGRSVTGGIGTGILVRRVCA